MRFLRRAWRAIGWGPRPAESLELFQAAERHRRTGRLEEATALVYRALALDPRSLLGHLLAAHLHAACRRTEPARMEFRTVLELDPHHPRALLGLARIAFEQGDLEGCQAHLAHALDVHADFPEARALHEMVSAARPPVEAGPATGRPATAPRILRLPLPVGSRECLLTRTDGGVVFSHPDPAATAVLGAHLARLSRVASATLARAGLGAMEQAVVESSAGTTFVRGDERLILALTLPREVPIGVGQRHADGLWTRCRAELEASV